MGKITDWWIAQYDSELNFVNVFDKKVNFKHLVVVGYLTKEFQLLATTSDTIIKRITKDGIETEEGFYSFAEAHEMYLQFLIDVNKDDNVIIATNWERCPTEESKIIADLTNRDGNVQKDIPFNFDSNGKTQIPLTGYSNNLNCTIVISPFATRTNNARLFEIPLDVKLDIYTSSSTTPEERSEKIKLVEALLSV